MPLRSQFQARGKVSIKSRIGRKLSGNTGPASLGIGAGGVRARGSIKSRLGAKNGPGNTTSPKITDARQKINLNRNKAGRMGDARERITIKRLGERSIGGLRSQQLQQQRGRTTVSVGALRRTSGPRGRASFNNNSPVKTLTITTPNSPLGGSAGLFANAVTRMGTRSSDYEYSSPPNRMSMSIYPPALSPPTMLTRTVANPNARGGNLYTRASIGGSSGGMYSNSMGIMSKSGRGMNTSSSARFRDESDDDMDVDLDMPPVIRPSLQARLDGPPKNKVIVSNLQGSVTPEDITELFADVGDLISSKMIGSGQAEICYKTKQDCLKAITAYNNRLLDGSPMKVVMVEGGVNTSSSSNNNTSNNTRGSTIAGLKSASGASMKIPKSSSSIKIQPDISAIHKVLFQPTSSSNSVKGLFKSGSSSGR